MCLCSDKESVCIRKEGDNNNNRSFTCVEKINKQGKLTLRRKTKLKNMKKIDILDQDCEKSEEPESPQMSNTKGIALTPNSEKSTSLNGMQKTDDEKSTTCTTSSGHSEEYNVIGDVVEPSVQETDKFFWHIYRCKTYIKQQLGCGYDMQKLHQVLRFLHSAESAFICIGSDDSISNMASVGSNSSSEEKHTHSVSRSVSFAGFEDHISEKSEAKVTRQHTVPEMSNDGHTFKRNMPLTQQVQWIDNKAHELQRLAAFKMATIPLAEPRPKADDTDFIVRNFRRNGYLESGQAHSSIKKNVQKRPQEYNKNFLSPDSIASYTTSSDDKCKVHTQHRGVTEIPTELTPELAEEPCFSEHDAQDETNITKHSTQPHRRTETTLRASFH